MAEFNGHEKRDGREGGRGSERGARRPNREEQREERRREAARHTGLMKAAFGREIDEAIENARIYEEGEGRSLLWGAEAAAAAEAAKRAAELEMRQYERACSTAAGFEQRTAGRISVRQTRRGCTGVHLGRCFLPRNGRVRVRGRAADGSKAVR